jgi:hypothetical protein
MTDVDAFLAMLAKTGITYDVKRDVDGSAGGPKYPQRVTQIRSGSVYLWFCAEDAVTYHGEQKAGALFDIFYCRTPVPA